MAVLFPLVSSASNISILIVSELMIITKKNPTITNSDGVKEKLPPDKNPEVIANEC